MSYKREVINVRVSRRVLWVGAQAYPLQNIARAQTIKLVPKREAAVRHYVMAVILWVLLASIHRVNRVAFGRVNAKGAL